MPIRNRYAKQKFNREFADMAANGVVTFPDGSEFTVVRSVTPEPEDAKAARLEAEAAEREKAREYQARYSKTPAGKLTQKTYAQTPAGKAIDQVKQERKREQKRTAPFQGLDLEGVNMWELAWIETVDYKSPQPPKPLPLVCEISARVANDYYGAGKIISFDKTSDVNAAQVDAAVVKFDNHGFRKIALTALTGPVPVLPEVPNPNKRLLSEVLPAEHMALLKTGGALLKDIVKMGGTSKGPRTAEPDGVASEGGEIKAIIDAGGAIYVPQKIIMLAAGNDEDAEVFCKVEGGLGRDAPGWSSIELMKLLCNISSKAPKGTNFVNFGGGYDATHIVKDVPFPKGWETVRQMAFWNKELIQTSEAAREEEPDTPMPDEPSIRRPVIWITTDPATGEKIGFGINYLKKKWLKIGILKYPDDHSRWYKRKKNGESAGLDYTKRIVIQDTISYFQTSFLTAMDGMKGAIEITKKEQELIDWGKPLRGDFSNQEISKIKDYNRAEITVLARMMEAFRKALWELGLQPKDWYGPGILAKEKLEKEGILQIKKKIDGVSTIVQQGHFPEFLRADKQSVAQDWAACGFSGGRIDLIRPGVHCDPDVPISQYDIVSAYPSNIFNFPSMRSETEEELEARIETWKAEGGQGSKPERKVSKYEKRKARELSLEEFKVLATSMNVLSMFEVQWRFKNGLRREASREELLAIFSMTELTKKEKEQRIMELQGQPIPFYPFFYRCNGTSYHQKGTILYPSTGWGRYYRDELLAAIAWCEQFPEAVAQFEFKGAMEFCPAFPDERPFKFVQELFDRRAAIVAETKEKVKEWRRKYGEPYMPPKPSDPWKLKKWEEELDKTAELHGGPKPYNIMEKVIKLILNSLYGKMAQSIGTLGELPKASNPFYAGAITAGTRAQLLHGMLCNPERVIFAATDGIMSLGPLEGETDAEFTTRAKAARAAGLPEPPRRRGLETVEGKVLGKWEHAGKLDVKEAAVFVHPGIYSFYDIDREPQTKTRGFKIPNPRDFLERDIVRGWKKGDDVFLEKPDGSREPIPRRMVPQVRDRLKQGEEALKVLKSCEIPSQQKKDLKKLTAFKGKLVYENKLPMMNELFVTIGMAISSEDNWKKAGCWRTQNRDMDLQSVGTKRVLCSDKRRAEQLVFVEPALNFEEELSAPYFPDWYDEAGLMEHEDEEEIEMKFGEREEE